MNCHTAREHMFDQPTAELEAHLTACPKCAQEFQAVRSTMALLDEWRAPEPSPFFNTRVRARVNEIKQKEESGAFAWLRRPFLGMAAWRPAAAATLATIMAVGVAVSYRNGADGAGPSDASIARDIKGTAVGDLLVLEKEQHIFTELELLDDLTADASADLDHI